MNQRKPITSRPPKVDRKVSGHRWICSRKKATTSLELSCDGQRTASALLVYAEFEPLHTLRVALASQGVDTWRTRSCQEALKFLAKFRPVHVIFTDGNLPDGTWADLVRAMPRTSVPVIVVARKMDTQLCSDIIQHGGSGLITPPFAASDLSSVVQRSRAVRHAGQRQESSPRGNSHLLADRAWPWRYDRGEANRFCPEAQQGDRECFASLYPIWKVFSEDL